MSRPTSNLAAGESKSEWRFLTQCVRAQLDGSGMKFPASDVAGLDWRAVVQLAEKNRVVPLLAAAVLANQVQNVPPAVAADLKERFRRCAQKGMFLVVELCNILASLRKAKVRCIPLKGPVLTASSYRKMGLRDFDDLDLLVAPREVGNAVAALAELGYSGWGIPESRIAAHLTTESEHQLICRERGITVDLHWAVGRKYFTLPMEFEELWGDTARTKLIGSDVPDLCPEDNLLFLCFHGGKHLFSRLSWVCDIAATITAHPNLSWDRLLAKANQMGARRLLLLGLFLAQELLGSKLPVAVKQAISSDRVLIRLATTVLGGLVRGADSAPAWRRQIADSFFHLRVRERLSDRLRYMFWAAAPNARDWSHSRLPPSLSFLLVFSRPFRLLRKSWRADAR